MRIILDRVEVRNDGRLSLINKCSVCKKEHRYGKKETEHVIQNPKKWRCSFSFGVKVSHCIQQAFHTVELYYYPSITKKLISSA